MGLFSNATSVVVSPAIAATRRLPAIRRLAWRAMYNLAVTERAGKLAELDFFNWGYSPLDPDLPRLELAAEQERDRQSIQLYHHIAGQVDLTDKEVLEVGCGRGGGAAFVKTRLGPASMVGIDLAEANAAVCNERHKHIDGLSFRPGDAENLPFDERSFDAVLNVESSHCYPDRLAFFREVFRVLRPGGHFLYGDIIDAPDLGRFRLDVRDCGLTPVHVEDITLNVLRSREVAKPAAEAFTQSYGRRMQAQIFNWAAIEGSANYRKLADGTTTYVCVLARK